MWNEHAQTDELLALSSIYDDEKFCVNEESKSGSFLVYLHLPQQFSIITTNAELAPIEHNIVHLPPIILYFQLLSDYPEYSAPVFQLSCNWLSLDQISSLCRHLDHLWNEQRGEVILFVWINFLENELLEFLHIDSPLDISNVLAKKRKVRLRTSSRNMLNKSEAIVPTKTVHDLFEEKQGLYIPQIPCDSVKWELTYNSSLHQENSCVHNNDTTHVMLNDASVNHNVAHNVGSSDYNMPLNIGIASFSKHTKNICDLSGGKQNGLKSTQNDNVRSEACNCDKFVYLPYDSRAIQDIASQDMLLTVILAYDQMVREKIFNSRMFTCEVCILERSGEVCLCFSPCDHVFCNECMTSYFNVQIREGCVKALTCPTKNCKSQAHPKQVQKLVDKSMYLRYERLLLQSTLDIMPDITYCPRPMCGLAVIADQKSNIGVCSCFFVFCTFCMRVYHGVSPCVVTEDQVKEICEAYTNGSVATKEKLEKQYGLKTIRQITETNFSEAWLEANSKKCPQCKARIQKIDGCHKMHCIKCTSCFCWLCLKLLPQVNPYLHFNVPNTPCYMKLFYGISSDNEDDGLDNFEFDAYVE